MVSGHSSLLLHETKDGVVRARVKEKKTVAEAIRLHLLRSALSKADSVTTCSRYLMSMTQLLMQGRPFNGHVVYNGIEFSRFAIRTTKPTEGKYLFAYGRLIYEKGFDLLISCFRDFLKQELEEYQLIIGGTGKELDNLKQLASGLGLDGRVIFPGRLSPQEVVAYLQHCMVAIIPSRKEPFGITLLEAIASQSNIVATDIGGMPEIAQYGNVLLCQPDQESLLQAIHEAIHKPGSGSPEKELELTEMFSCEQMIDQFEKIFFHSLPASTSNSLIQPVFQKVPEKISKRWT
jgi:glycosyltransferase involved in cell wall biosynthesis